MYLSRAQLTPKRISSTDLPPCIWVEESFPEEIKRENTPESCGELTPYKEKSTYWLQTPAPKAFARYAVPHTCETRDYTS